MSHPSQGPGSPADSAGTPGTLTRRLVQGAGVIVVSSVMFSTPYYIGAIVEQSIGPAAPW